MQRKRWGLPIALGLITAVLLVAALWPKETPQRTLVVAARDLGAGTTLVAADLTTAEVDAARAPAQPTSWLIRPIQTCLLFYPEPPNHET